MDAEAVLLERLQKGDEGALAELYESLSGNVYTLALQLLHSREEAEEVLQDTFLKLYRNLHGFQAERGSARAFIYTVARNACLSRLRAKRARPHKAENLDVHDPDASLGAISANPSMSVEVRQALDQLEPVDQQLLGEAFFSGYSHGELAARFDMPLGTVKSRVRRALLSLRQFPGERVTRVRDNLAEYVLGTLEPSELGEVEAYLARSADARAEVRQLWESLVTLTESLPSAAPRAEVWTNIQAQLYTQPLSADSRSTISPLVTVFHPRKWPSLVIHLGWQLAACFCLIAAGSLLWGSRSYSAYQKIAGEALLVAAFLSEPQVQKVTLNDPDNQGIGGVLLEPEGRALFVMDQAPGRGRTYQAWGHTSDDWEPGSGEHLVSLKVSQDKVFTAPTQGFAALYLSLEPTQGSPQPTHPLSRVSLSEPAPATALEIAGPVDGETLASDSVIVSGSVGDGVTDLSYTLNGDKPERTGVAGNRFTFTVSGLQKGLNTITVTAVLEVEDQRVTDAVTVTYLSPGTGD